MHVEALKAYGVLKQKVSFKTDDRMAVLQQRLLQASFFNLLLVSLLGILLRTYPFLPSFSLAYKNVLHGHSHFAFGGWVMPVLLALLLKLFPEIAQKVAYRHWRNVSALLLSSAYGMLLSFPVQGYGVVSIIFSTLSIGAGYYLAVVIWKALKELPSQTSYLFLKAGLFYLAISAIGPFATGPLIAMGKAGTPIYYNAVYFYLHFQYNGWFTFAVLALLYKMLEAHNGGKNGKTVFRLMNWACLPAYFLSVLWNQPSVLYNIIGGIAALLQLVALYFLLKDVKSLKTHSGWIRLHFIFSLAAFILKNLLQLAGAFPAVALMAYQHRSFVIAYLHLVLLGFISLFAFATAFQSYSIRLKPAAKTGLIFFLFSFVTTEVLLVASSTGNILGFTLPFYTIQLLVFSLFFPAGLALLSYNINQQLRSCLS